MARFFLLSRSFRVLMFFFFSSSRLDASYTHTHSHTKRLHVCWKLPPWNTHTHAHVLGCDVTSFRTVSQRSIRRTTAKIDETLRSTPSLSLLYLAEIVFLSPSAQATNERHYKVSCTFYFFRRNSQWWISLSSHLLAVKTLEVNSKNGT